MLAAYNSSLRNYVTANHYIADVLAGLALLGVSYLLAVAVTRWLDRRYATRAELRVRLGL